jgi:hypothetical protein
MSLREEREKIIPKPKDFPEEILNRWDLWYTEKNYKKNKLYKLLMFLRKKGMNLNKFLTKKLKENKQNQKK